MNGNGELTETENVIFYVSYIRSTYGILTVERNSYVLLQRQRLNGTDTECWKSDVIDEKTFTVASPVNHQNDRVYSCTGRKRDVPVGQLIREREHFSRNVMVSVGVSRMGKTRVVFIDPGAKIAAHTVLQYRPREGSAALHQSNMSSIITGGHCSRTEHQRTPPGPRWTI